MKKIIITFLILFQVTLISAQVVRKSAGYVEPEISKGILTIFSSEKGDLYFNEYLLTRLIVNDTVSIVNLEPGNYRIQFKGEDLTSPQIDIDIKARHVAELNISRDSLRFTPDVTPFYETIEQLVGKPVIYIKDRFWYLNVNYSLFDPSKTMLMLNASYQLIPQFCPGIGIMYFSESDEYIYNQDAARLIPVYLHLRSYLNSGKIASYFKINVGTNLATGNKTDSIQPRVVNGGSYVSPGVGVRFAILKNLSVTTELEYTDLQARLKYNSSTDIRYMVRTFYFTVGVGYQFQVKQKIKKQ